MKFPTLSISTVGTVSLLLGFCHSALAAAAPQPTPQAPSAACLIFSDEFDKFNTRVWKHDMTMGGGGNFEFQVYTNNRTNTFVKDGIFYIKPTLTSDRIGEAAVTKNGVMDMWGTDPATECTGNFNNGCYRLAGTDGNILNPVQSANIRSVNSFSFKYGKVDVRAKLPKGKWLWPAIWMLPADYQYGTWPASGEIDLMESRGNDASYSAGGNNKMGSTLHWGPDYHNNKFMMTHAEYTLPNGTFSDDFHLFTLDWQPNRIRTYVDGNLALETPTKDMFARGKFPATTHNPWEGGDSDAPFDQEFYLMMNVAVAGTSGYFPDGVANKPWNNSSPHAVNEFYTAKDDWYPTWGPVNGTDNALAIDYIRVYKNDCT